MLEPITMKQQADNPTVLFELVDKLKYKRGWSFVLEHTDRGQGSSGLTLSITVVSPDSYDPSKNIAVVHYMIVPAAGYDRRSWQRWLFDQLLLVEQHEACEFFIIDSFRPYAPHHGPGNNPYTIFDHGTAEDAQTTFRGEHFELVKEQ